MSNNETIHQQREPTRREWIALMSALLGAFMAVLDIQITNSSLQDIQGALAATVEEGSWISTAYLVAEIVMIPLTAWLTQLFSVRRLAIWVSTGFLVSSFLCSMAWNLESMIAFRALQGFTGGALIPLAFTLILTSLPPHHRTKGMALFALTATFAPSIGPGIGGWLTDNYGWQYIFYINIPPGLIMMAGLLYGLDKGKINWSVLKSADFLGILTMAVGLGSLQVFLEEGYKNNWLESNYIVTLASIAFVSLGLFVILQISRPNSLINLSLFRNRNFGLSALASFGVGIGLYGSVYILPLYLAQVQGYNALQIGKVIMIAGVPQLFIIPLVPKLITIFPAKIVCAIGFAIFAFSSYASGSLNLDFSGDQFNSIQIIRALGQPLIMVTLSIIATSYIEPKNAGSASSLYNICRNLGGAIGIALLATLLNNRTKIHFDYLREYITQANPQFSERMTLLTHTLKNKDAALGAINNSTHLQALIMAYNDAFHCLALVLILSLIAILLTKKLPASLDTNTTTH